MSIRFKKHWTLAELGDINLTEPVDDFDTIVYDETTGNWINYPNYQLAEANPTGLINGGELNIFNSTNIEIIAGVGLIVDSYTFPADRPVITFIEWNLIQEPITANPAIAGSVVYFTMADSGVAGVEGNIGLLKQYADRPSPQVLRDEIPLGTVVHNGTQWNEISSPTVVNNSVVSLVEYTKQVIGLTYIVEGGSITEAIGHTLDQAQGIIWELNRNWHVDKKDPHREQLPQLTAFSFRYVNRDFTTVGALINIIDVTQWDNLGIIEPISGGNNNSTIQRLYLDPADNYWILYGQEVYSSFSEAVVNSQRTVTVPPLLVRSVYLGSIISSKNETDWSTDSSIFIPAVGAGGSTGGGTPFIPTTFTGAGTTGYVPDPVLAERKVLADNGQWEYRTKMVEYVENGTFYPQETVFNDGYLSVAQVITTDYPTPLEVGESKDIYAGADPTTQVSAKQVIFGTRYTPSTLDYKINSVRAYVITGNNYTVYSIVNPDTDNIITEMANFTANSTGWIDIPVTPKIILVGTVLDIVAKVNEPDPSPTTFSGNWDYITPNNPDVPTNGQINQDNKNTGFININYIDNDGGDRTLELQGLDIGDIIDAVGVRWSIQSFVENGTYRTFSVSPSIQGSPLGVGLWTFETVSETPITYMSDLDYYVPRPDVSGLLGVDIDYSAIVPDQTAYGIDINLTQVNQSPDWKIFGVK